MENIRKIEHVSKYETIAKINFSNTHNQCRFFIAQVLMYQIEEKKNANSIDSD